MDRNFARSLALVLKSEGGWSDNPKDPGGATMKGVTLANYRRYVKAGATKADLKKISDDEVATVYRKFYWDAVAGDALPDGVDYATMDFGVNSGPGRSAKYLQAVAGVPQDGRIGPTTLAAVEAKPADIVINALCDARLAFLKKLPTWGEFGRGWSDRVRSVRANALKMAAQSQAASPAAVPAAPDDPQAQPAAHASPGAPVAAPAVDKDTIARVQQQLKDLGYTEVGNVDGKPGDFTASAIRAFRTDNGLPAGDGIDDDLLLALQKAKPRVIPAARADAPADVVRDKVPEVKANWLSKVGGYIVGIPAAIGAVVKPALDNIPVAKTYIDPLTSMASDVPGWVWLAGVAGIAGTLVLVARHGEKKGVEAFQTGARR